VSPALLADGASAAQDAALTHRMPVRVVCQSPNDLPAWLTAMNAAVDGVLSD
jgi:hypothetical protein